METNRFVFKTPELSGSTGVLNNGEFMSKFFEDHGKEKSTNGSSQLDPSAYTHVEKTPRLPRWTRQEILVLIEGKRVDECNGRKSRIRNGEDGRVSTESKWSSISSYCKRHGVNREPIQCRKRWSNLSGDYKRIRDWEIRNCDQSFWCMRNDVRRENKLPGFFDREVYSVLEMCLGKQLSAKEEMMPEAVFDSGRSNVEEGLFSDFEQSGQEEGEGTPDKETLMDSPSTMPPGVISDRVPTPYAQTGSDFCASGQKRKHHFREEENDGDLREQLFSILERNNRMLTAHVEAQNLNSQLDRKQRKEHADGLVGVLGKLADALGRIADKIQ